MALMVSTMNYSVITPATAEPVTAAELRRALRLADDETQHDAELASLAKSAREVAEQQAGIWVMAQRVRLSLLEWPAALRVPRGPVRQVQQVTFWTGAAWSVVDASLYVAEQQGTHFVVEPINGWPSPASKPGARVRVDLDVGWPDAASVPECIKRFILAQVVAWFDNPAAAQAQRLEPHPYLSGLLDPVRTFA